MNKQPIETIGGNARADRIRDVFRKYLKPAAATAAVLTLAAFAFKSAATADPSASSPTSTQNVNVVNTPTVNVGTIPAVTLSSSATVKVGNTSANPVPSFDVEKLARIPYQSKRSFGGCMNVPCGLYLSGVPT